ncbi:trans-sulfuration enzyme family protein [Haliangium ochraceum]|uniref:Cystathionine gamma-lyase n=1 Tax=Haliangium ochraceum (strain DSM 14365 / JCM 11303 / SMP-2) TaxID=502025 RepID=D0LWI3_HALO1|nr:PLP-dependent transferase [Haliangium ochraceum]ACY17633.1 Cystathionine gamma-lyase [Haliangium ochraceum DSM 14365]
MAPPDKPETRAQDRFPRRVGDYTLESYLLHFADPTEAGPVVPDIPASATYRARDSAHLAELFQSLIMSDPERDQIIPEGAYGIYQRLGNPVEWQLARAFAMVQGGETAVVFSDGMRAVSAAVSICTYAGAEIICGVPAYGCTDNFFSGVMARDGREVHFVDVRDLDTIRRALNRRTRVIYCESVANPNMRVANIPAIKQIVAEENARRYPEEKITLIVDNTFPSPFSCWPNDVGPKLEEMIIVHSATKSITGFGSGLAGVAVIPWSYWKAMFLYRKDTGGSLPATEAHSLLTRSLKTMPLRIRRQVDTAGKLASFLDEHPKVDRVFYPGLPSFQDYDLARELLVDWDGNFSPGYMISFSLKGESPADCEGRGRELLDSLNQNSKLFTLAVSLGYVGTLVEEPTSGTHASMPDNEREAKGIPRGLLRLSVGLEDPEDLIRDLSLALSTARD